MAYNMGFPGGSMVKNPPANTGDPDSVPGQKDPLEKEMAISLSTVAWRIPRTKEPGRLQVHGVTEELGIT